MQIAVIVADSNGRYPVPASKGGSIATLMEHLLQCNEVCKKANLTIISYFDEKAFELSGKYKNSNFIWIRIPKFIDFMDKIFLKLISILFPKKKQLSYISVFSLLYYIYKGNSILRNNNFDAIIVENNIISMNVLRGLQKKYVGKYYLHLHNIPRTTGFAKNIIRNCKGILCVSNFVGKQIAKANNPIGPIEQNKIKIFYNCIDTNKFKVINANDKQLLNLKSKYHISDDKFVIVFVGRLSYEKGADRLLEATMRINDKKIMVLIIGNNALGKNYEDSYLAKLKKMAAIQETEVIFTGYIPNDKLVYYYNIANVAVLPSIWDEPAGLTMVEAMACGIPVITTNAGGIPEYVGKEAIIIKNNAQLSENIANCICELRSKSQNTDITSRAVNRIVDNFSNKIYLQRLIDTIQ